jgi:hypothetical protein
MRADLSAITVHGPGCRVDLVVPNTVPLVELTPALADACGVEADDAHPPAWTLARPGQTPIPVAASLSDARVRDGDVLHLVDVAAWDGPRVSPAAEQADVAVGADERPVTEAAPMLVALGGMALLIATAVLATVLAPTRASAGPAHFAGSAGPALLAASAAILMGAYLVGTRPDRAPARVALCVAAWAMAAAAGWSVTGDLLGASLAGSAALAASIPLVRAAAAGLGVVAVAVTGATAVTAKGGDPVAVLAVVMVVAVYAQRLLPALLNGWLTRRPDDAAAVSPRAARALLISLTYGCAVAASAAAVALAFSRNGYALGLVAAGAAALGLRALTFRYAGEAAAPALAAIIALLAATCGLTAGVLAGRHLLGAGVVGTAALGIALILATLRRRRGPREPVRLLRLWPLVDACTAPLLLGALGVIGAVSHWAVTLTK